MYTLSPRARRALAALTILAVTMAATACEPRVGPPPVPPPDRVAPEVRHAVDGGGQATFWVRFEQTADLAHIPQETDWAARGQAVVVALKRTAAASQADAKDKLHELGADFRPFWITNAIEVTGDAEVLGQMAADPGVKSVTAPETLRIPDPDEQIATPSRTESGIEWNVDAIGAPTVWDTYGARGDGIVVANIDTGVQFDHPALAGHYRGVLGNGLYSHMFNWFDPTGICGYTPCDNNGHGTHTMGTMVGDPGDPGNDRIGVAPHARWIAAKGCETRSCSEVSLLAAAQWTLAPTLEDGTNPRPDLRPNIVNNSWGGGRGDPWFQDMVRAWNASGIFATFAAGNDGPSCGSAGSPGDDPEAYAVGAYGSGGQIASFSGRGASAIAG